MTPNQAWHEDSWGDEQADGNPPVPPPAASWPNRALPVCVCVRLHGLSLLEGDLDQAAA